jgi:hypothetical protein
MRFTFDRSVPEIDNEHGLEFLPCQVDWIAQLAQRLTEFEMLNMGIQIVCNFHAK